ncbi:MAG: polyprenol monophosphomannose synthase [Acidimicrobiales bacterium]
MPTDVLSIAIIVPTRHEARNVWHLYCELAGLLTGWQWQLLFVDDSDDDTVQVLRELAQRDERVRVLHRSPRQRHGGLSGAVVQGFELLGSTADALVVMDADLQHPPTIVPRLINGLTELGADLAVASRYVGGGSADGLVGAGRNVVSHACRLAAHLCVRCSRPIADPMSGFFAVRPEVLSGVTLRPTGYKILLEIAARGHWSRFVEVPYDFQARREGRSKSTTREGVRFLRHLWLLTTATGYSGLANNGVRNKRPSSFGPFWAERPSEVAQGAETSGRRDDRLKVV